MPTGLACSLLTALLPIFPELNSNLSLTLRKMSGVGIHTSNVVLTSIHGWLLMLRSLCDSKPILEEDSAMNESEMEPDLFVSQAVNRRPLTSSEQNCIFGETRVFLELYFGELHIFKIWFWGFYFTATSATDIFSCLRRTLTQTVCFMYISL